MKSKLGNFVKASLFAVPFALPTVVFAQSAGGSSSGTIGATDNTSTRESKTTTTTSQTGAADDSKPMDSDSHTGRLGVDRDGNSTSDSNPSPSSDTTSDVDQHTTKRKTVQKHIHSTNDDGTSSTTDSKSSTTDKDINAR